MAEIGTDIEKAKSILEAGGLVAIPTETVYGLAGNALNAEAVTKIFEAKNRPHFDPLIVHVPDFDAVSRYAEDIPETANALARNFWPGPLTMVLRKKAIIPDLVSAGLDTVGLRCPNHELTRTLLMSLAFPLAAPSANPFGYVSPTQPAHVNEQLGDRIQYILDGGTCDIGIESTIIGFEGEPAVYRMGGLTIEAIQHVIGNIALHTHSTSNPKAPGQLISHYAPAKILIVGDIEKMLEEQTETRKVVISFTKDYAVKNQIILSPSGSLQEAAKNLFSALRHADKMPVDIILTELVPDVGIGKAINDRLKRAAWRSEVPRQ